MEINFKKIKKFLIIFDIIMIPTLIYQVVKGNNTIVDWIVLILANICLVFTILKNKNNDND